MKLKKSKYSLGQLKTVKSSQLAVVINYIVLTLIGAFFLIPFFWMIITAFKTPYLKTLKMFLINHQFFIL